MEAEKQIVKPWSEDQQQEEDDEDMARIYSGAALFTPKHWGQ